jgi:hypothetical protein
MLMMLLLSSTTLEATPHKFGGNKILNKKNKRNKKLLKKWGIGQAEIVKWEEVANG